MSGRFITFEGVDGTGKTTQSRRLVAELRRQGLPVVATREPGGTSLGEKVRELVLRTGAAALAPEAELALIFAARAQHLAEVIQPALERGAIVICDRFTDASEAYQGAGRRLGTAVIHALHHELCHDVQPDLTLVLDMELEPALERAQHRLARESNPEGRFEQESLEFYARVWQAYRTIAARETARCRLIDAQGSEDDVAARVWSAVASVLPVAAPTPQS